MKSKYLVLFFISFILFIFFIFPSIENSITGLTPGSSCCHYHLGFNMKYDKFREKYHEMFKGEVNMERGEIILIYGSYFRVTNGRPIADTSKTFVSFGDFCYDTSDIHNNQNYKQLSRVYYWKRKFLLWKIKSFFAEDMIKFEYETLFE